MQFIKCYVVFLLLFIYSDIVEMSKSSILSARANFINALLSNSNASSILQRKSRSNKPIANELDYVLDEEKSDGNLNDDDEEEEEETNSTGKCVDLK